tara:strand:- start:1708 stop:2379 length:672 start_codon:yes stop_codon:yes gene_type:complete
MKTLVIAPHPDDELLGCGGTLLKRVSEGVKTGWLIMTSMSPDQGWSKEYIESREKEIEEVKAGLKIKSENLYKLNFPPAQLDSLPLSNLIKEIAITFESFQPSEVFLPHPGDIHSDHRVCFEAAIACTKWFRFPYIKKILTYETISETDAMLDSSQVFSPNVFVDISKSLDHKWDLLKIYKSEMHDFPFPRSEEAIKSMARVRGAQSGFSAAEAFCLLRERQY